MVVLLTESFMQVSGIGNEIEKTADICCFFTLLNNNPSKRKAIKRNSSE
jgi:hypothetical protein